MANCDNLFRDFNGEGNLQITKTKDKSLRKSRKNVRDAIREHFEENHPKYKPTFYTQGSYSSGTTIRTKDDTCDMDDGVYFKSNPDKVSGTTLQKWIKDAVDGITDTTPSHRRKCITVDFKAGYNIDLPVFVFDNAKDEHPALAVKESEFQLDDPKDFADELEKYKDSEEQFIRIVRYLKAWCDYKREKMPSGLAMTVLGMKHLQKNTRDDVALKYTLIEIERSLKQFGQFKCLMPTTPYDNLFEDYTIARKDNFLKNLADFISDAKKAVDEEKNPLKASKLWQKHLGGRFPDGKDTDEKSTNSALLNSAIGSARPYFGIK
jgi:hypothetical protein